MRLLRGEIESLADLPQRERSAHQESLAAAAMLPCALLGEQSATSDTDGLSPLAKQALLAAAAAAVTAFGSSRPDSVVQALPAALALAADTNAAVRGSALVALAAATQAVGTRLVPLLPTAIKAALSSGQAAAGRLLAAAAGKDVTVAAPRAAVADGGDDEGDEPGAAAEEADAVELAASLAALCAMVRGLGAFVSPYLGDVISLAINPAVLSCSSAGCAAAAAALRSELPAVVPARLLLEPLFRQLPAAVEGGLQSTLALLSAVTLTVEKMDSKTAAAYHEQVFLFLLRALDVRALSPASLAATPSAASGGSSAFSPRGIHEAERAAIAALVALVMKLTESCFKPLFLRLLDWAAAAGGAHGVGDEGLAGADAATARQTVLFSVAAALTERLRSVFVPYFRYLLDKTVRHLSADGSGLSSQPHRSKKKQRKNDDPDAASQSSAAALLRMRVVRALHHALRYDSAGFFDAEKLERLLPPLVAQLQAPPPPPDVDAVLAAQCAAPDLDGYLKPASGKQQRLDKAATRSDAYDAMGVAVAAALVQMGVTANSDVFWKPLNHRVLMSTRGGSSVRTRLLALEVVANLVERLREEYLVLLPEVSERGSRFGMIQRPFDRQPFLSPQTIPFVAELLEDSELAVETRTQQLVALLEEISGEKLDGYMKT